MRIPARKSKNSSLNFSPNRDLEQGNIKAGEVVRVSNLRTYFNFLILSNVITDTLKYNIANAIGISEARR